MPQPIDDFKKAFSRSEKVHLNNAGLSPISAAARDRILYWGNRFFTEGFYSDGEYMLEVDQARQNLATLLGCQKQEVAFFQNTASAVSQIAFEFGLGPEDEVLLWDQEYSSNLYPWKKACDKSGAKLVMAETPQDFETSVEALLKFATPRTKLVALSWVQFQTGALTHISELVEKCHQRNIFVCVDVMQGLGYLDFEFEKWKVDAVCGGSHKWLVSPVGVGFLALAERHMDRFSPHNVGSATYGTCDDPASLECLPKRDASKFEPGSKQVLEIVALAASIELILKVGVATIGAEALRLTMNLKRGLEDRGFQVLGPAVPVTPFVNFNDNLMNRHRLDEIVQSLSHQQINFARRGPGLRLSPHAHNRDEDIERVWQALEFLK